MYLYRIKHKHCIGVGRGAEGAAMFLMTASICLRINTSLRWGVGHPTSFLCPSTHNYSLVYGLLTNLQYKYGIILATSYSHPEIRCFTVRGEGWSSTR